MTSRPRRAPRTGAGGTSPGLQQGIAYQQQGNLAAADAAYRRVPRRDPDYGQALRLRGLVARQRGDGEGAIRLLRKAVEVEPANPVFHHTLAEACMANDRLRAAIAAYRRAWTLDPARRATGEDLAQAQERAGFVSDAIATLTSLLPDHPQAARIRVRIALMHYECGELDAAEQIMRDWQGAVSDTADAWRELGRGWASIYHYGPAADCYRKALALQPDSADACAGLGSALQLQGDFDQAVGWMERALTWQPDLGWVYPALLTNRRYRLDAERLAALQRLSGDEAVDAADRMHMHFALGMHHDRLDEAGPAFRHFAAANAVHARREPFSPEIFDARIGRIERTCDAAFFASHRDQGDPSERPLFIVGMPRSGTSLVEQIIASHPRAFGAGELMDMNRLMRELPAHTRDGTGYPEAIAQVKPEVTRDMARRYLGSLAARDADALRVTDKMPMNFLWLGLIAVLFPNARVVYCRRDAMDNCLSCFFQDFSQGLRFCYDLTHLGGVYRQHERLMAHWARCLPLPILTVDYEALVHDQEAQTRRLIAFTGLDWDDHCLAFHTTRRDVQTASTWQVRQPMYQSSVARWKHYEAWLGPLRESLAGTGAGVR